MVDIPHLSSEWSKTFHSWLWDCFWTSSWSFFSGQLIFSAFVPSVHQPQSLEVCSVECLVSFPTLHACLSLMADYWWISESHFVWMILIDKIWAGIKSIIAYKASDSDIIICIPLSLKNLLSSHPIRNRAIEGRISIKSGLGAPSVWTYPCTNIRKKATIMPT